MSGRMPDLFSKWSFRNYVENLPLAKVDFKNKCLCMIIKSPLPLFAKEGYIRGMTKQKLVKSKHNSRNCVV
jgi:hypothetical protein